MKILLSKITQHGRQGFGGRKDSPKKMKVKAFRLQSIVKKHCAMTARARNCDLAPNQIAKWHMQTQQGLSPSLFGMQHQIADIVKKKHSVSDQSYGLMCGLQSAGGSGKVFAWRTVRKPLNERRAQKS